MKHYILTLILAAIGLLSSAEITTMRVDTFQKLKVSNSLNVDCIHCPDSVGYIVINSTHREHTSWVEAQIKGDKLMLRLAIPGKYTGNKTNLPHVTLYTNNLTHIENEGDSTVRVFKSNKETALEARVYGNGRISLRDVKAEKVKASVFAGNGTIALNGKAINSTYAITGDGTIEADGLECKEANIKLTGNGTIGVNATEKIAVRGSGYGHIYYYGSPQLESKIVIGLKIEPIR